MTFLLYLFKWFKKFDSNKNILDYCFRIQISNFGFMFASISDYKISNRRFFPLRLSADFSLSILQNKLNTSLEQRPMLHFSKMGFPAEWDPSSCTHAAMWFLVPKRVYRGRYNTILSLPKIGKNDISHL